MYQIYFYKTASNKEVVLDFIEKLDTVQKARTRNSIRLLEKHGLTLLENKSVKKISKNPKIYELRVVGKIQIRLLFFIYDQKRIIITHIFIKKTKKTPLQDLRLAIKRTKEFT